MHEYFLFYVWNQECVLYEYQSDIFWNVGVTWFDMRPTDRGLGVHWLVDQSSTSTLTFLISSLVALLFCWKGLVVMRLPFQVEVSLLYY